MKKMFNKAVLNGTTVMGDGLTYPRIPNVYTGDNEGGYQRGDMMDANAVVEMIKELTDTGKITIEELQNLINEEIQERVEGDQDQQRYTDQKIKDLIGTSPETLDTLKEIADALGEDPDFAANVWNKLAEVDQTLEDYKRASNLPKYVVASGEDSKLPISFELSSNGINLNVYRIDLDTGDIVPDKITNVIPKATQYMPGLMSAYDKIKTDRIPLDLVTSMSVVLDDPSNIKIKYYGKTLDGNSWHSNANIKPATSSVAGAMSASDKQKLDSLVNYQAGNGIDITGNTISCTLDTSLYSIVTELPETGLPNKIYLLPSTETEEGNIYTEYGYVDNKWEELGKYKADVNLSPYAKALNLPRRIVGQDVEGDGIMSSHYYPDKVKVKFVSVNLIDNNKLNDWFDISSATTSYAGVISCIDKRKLDSIEKNAQVNKIESVSVNGIPLEVTNKGVDIPAYELPAATDTTLGGIKTPARAVVNGTMPIDNVLRVNDSGELKLNVDFKYDKLTKKLVLELITGVGHVKTKEVDCTDFIKDGMLESANIVVNPEGHDAGTYIKLVFNTDAGKDPVYINVSDLIHEYTAGDGIKLNNGKFSLDTIEHTERSYTTKLIGPKEEPALNIPIVDESGKLNKNILIPNVADLSNRTPTEWTGEIDDLGCIRYEDYKNISDYYYNFTKNIFFYPIQDNQLLMYNIGKGIDDDKLSDFLKNPNNYDNWNIPVAIYLSDGLLADGGLYGEVPVHDPNDDSKIYYPGGVFGFKVNIDKSKNNLLTFTEGEDYIDGFSPAIVNTKKLIVPKQSVIDTIVNSNEFKAKQDALTEAQLNNINNAITSISINDVEQVNTNGAVNLTIPNATTSKEGLMSKEDKTKLDSLENYTLPAATTTTIGGLRVPKVVTSSTGSSKINHLAISLGDRLGLAYELKYFPDSNELKLQYFNGTKGVLDIASTIDCTNFIKNGPNASITENGLMSKEDKAKLDSQPTIKANDATGVADDDYVVIKKSELNSILSRLSALENKA